MTEYISALDTRVLETLYAARDPNFTQAFIWISELGRPFTVYGVGVCVALFLALRRHFAHATGLLISLGTSSLVVLLMKGLVERARPPQEYWAYLEVWYSFPSAHAAFSAALYGFFSYLAWCTIRNPFLKILAVVSLSVLMALISFSRLYLGIHYLTDVIAGIAVGALCAWAGVWWTKFARKV